MARRPGEFVTSPKLRPPSPPRSRRNPPRHGDPVLCDGGRPTRRRLVLARGRPDSRALIRVDNRTPGSKRRSFHLILAPRDGRRLDDFENMMSDDRLGATVVWDSRETSTTGGVHLHGSMFSRNNPDTAAYNVRFPADRLFRGVHRTVQIKRRVIQEILAKHAQNQSGVPGMYDDIIHLFSQRPGNAGPARVSLAHYNDVFLDSQYENGAEGTLLNMEGIPASPWPPRRLAGWHQTPVPH